MDWIDTEIHCHFRLRLRGATVDWIDTLKYIVTWFRLNGVVHLSFGGLTDGMRHEDGM